MVFFRKKKASERDEWSIVSADDTKKYPNEIRLCDCFFDYRLQLFKSKKNIEELFSTVEC